MLKRLKTVLTARSTGLALILFLTASLTAAVIVPQGGRRFDAGATGSAPLPPHPLLQLIGLDHVFSTWWFTALAVIFAFSLLLSTFAQFRSARERMRQPPGETGESGMPTPLSREQVGLILARSGYRPLAVAAGAARYVKLWPGYWGSFLFHLGMTITVACSLVYVLTENRVGIHAVSGSGVPVDPAADTFRRGLLARPLPLPEQVMLTRLEPAYAENDHLEDLTSRYIFYDRQRGTEEIRLGVNDQRRYHGLLVYQLTRFGNAFSLEFRNGPGGDFRQTVRLPMPQRRDKAGYGTFPLEHSSLLLKTKYYTSADRSGMNPENPQLVLRLYDGERLLAETTLLRGQTGRLGTYDVTLEGVEWWVDILFEGSMGTLGIFSGFCLLLCGGAVIYFAIPREVVVRDAGAGCTLQWSVPRFVDSYREERDLILSQCKGESEA